MSVKIGTFRNDDRVNWTRFCLYFHILVGDTLHVHAQDILIYVFIYVSETQRRQYEGRNMP